MARRARRSQGRWPVLALAALVLITMLGSPAIAQTESAPGHARLNILDARITGDGPWTSWLGGPADRQLLLVIENVGDQPLEGLTLSLRQGKGNPTEPIDAPAIETLAPGDQATLLVDIDLPPFAFGTHAIIGEFGGLDDPSRFRAETSHIPWLLLALPTLVLLQLAMVAVRNRARRALAAAATAPRSATPQPKREPAPAPALLPRDPALARVIHHELDVALREVLAHDQRTDFETTLHRQAATTTARVARQLEIEPRDRPALAAEITEALLTRVEAERVATP